MTWRWANVPLPERFLGAIGVGAARFGASFEDYRASRPRYLRPLRSLILRAWPRTA